MKKLSKRETIFSLIVLLIGMVMSIFPARLWQDRSFTFRLLLSLSGFVLVLVEQIGLYRRTRQECNFFVFLYHTGRFFLLLFQLGYAADIYRQSML